MRDSQHLMVKNRRILLQQSFTARMTLQRCINVCI